MKAADHDYLTDTFHHVTRLLLRQARAGGRRLRPGGTPVAARKGPLVVSFRAIEQLARDAEFGAVERAH